MLYNKREGRIQQMVDCLSCEFFDSTKKMCLGINKNCFAYDEKTKTAYDTNTKLPIKAD